MLFCQVSRKGKGPAVQPSTQHGKGPLGEAMGSLIVFSTLKLLSAHNTYINSPRAGGRPMPSLKMSHQGLFGGVTPDTLNTMKLHLLPMTLKMEVRHNPGSQDFATIFTRISSIPRVGPHILLEGPGIGKALTTGSFPRLKRIPHPWFQLTPTSPYCPSLGLCYVPDSSLSLAPCEALTFSLLSKLQLFENTCRRRRLWESSRYPQNALHSFGLIFSTHPHCFQDIR